MKQAKKNQQKIQGMEAVILDMDGVITQTAKVHKKAWKEMFDYFLQEKDKHQPLTTDEDYIQYIDGKPRFDGIRSFLESRNIKLPDGSPDDAPGRETVWGLGNKKNAIFLNLLKENGVDIYPEAIRQIKHWRNHSLKTAVVSSSKNCRHILEIAGIEKLFDVRVDGVTAQEDRIKGKPAPDMFIEASRRLGTGPDSCVVFEDAISGVQAGSNGNFALVVGVDRTNNEAELYENGADIVVINLGEIDLFNKRDMESYFIQKLPSAFMKESEIHKLISDKSPVLLLDFNSTLSPVKKYEKNAVLSEEMKNVLRKCVSKFTVIIIGEGDTDDLKKRVNIENCIYVGKYGRSISVSPGITYKQTEKESSKIRTNDKRNKGKAITRIMDKLNISDNPGIMPVYIGDDIADEDAFRVLSEGGIAILVGAHNESSEANYSLKNVYQVRSFLQELSGLKRN